LQRAVCNPTYGVRDILNDARIINLKKSTGDVSQFYAETLSPVDRHTVSRIIDDGCFIVDNDAFRHEFLSRLSVKTCQFNRCLHNNVMVGGSEVGHEISI
jgi:hypothetical protein